MASQTSRKNLARLGGASAIAFMLLWIWLLWSKMGENPIIIEVTPPHDPLAVMIPQGVYIGVRPKGEYSQTLEEFLGIPYALAPEGPRRFRPPVGVAASSKVFHASKYGNRCPSGGETSIPQSEDCLNLNIFRPEERPSKKPLPVLVHIHGGAFNQGTGSNRNVRNMVGWAAEPFIGVSFNYRIGALGFLPSKLTEEEGILNLGLKDQALLLDWIQENIAAFGGDPDNVTIMGSSAGAHSVGHHIMRQFDSSPPFHRAIIESGATTARAVYPPSHELHEEQFNMFIKRLGYDTVPKDKLMDTLREADVGKIKSVSDGVFSTYNPSIRWPFQPVIDGEGGMIPRRPIESWNLGKWNKISIITGYNTNEGAMFVPGYLRTNEEFVAFFKLLLPSLSDKDLELLCEIYPDPFTNPDSKYKDGRQGYSDTQYMRVEQAYAHFAYIAPVQHTAHFAAASDSPVYLYHFAVNSSVSGGANHGDQNGFTTYNKDVRDKSETINEISGTMSAYWASFIITGDPNTVRGRYPDRPHWPVYTTSNRKNVVFGDGNDEGANGGHKGIIANVKDENFALEERKYWWERTSLFES